MTFNFDRGAQRSSGWMNKFNNNNCSQTTYRANQAFQNVFYSQCNKNIVCEVQDSLLYPSVRPRDYEFEGAPILLSTSQNRVDVLVPLENDTILHQSYTADSQRRWHLADSNPLTINNNTKLMSPPAAVSKSKTHVDIELYVVTEDGNLVHRNYDGVTWKPWTSIKNITSPNGGKITSPPILVYWPDSDLTCLFMKEDTSLYYRELQSSGTGNGCGVSNEN